MRSTRKVLRATKACGDLWSMREAALTGSYRQRKAGLAPFYICQGPSEVDRTDKGPNSTTPGKASDKSIGAPLVETVTPLGTGSRSQRSAGATVTLGMKRATSPFQGLFGASLESEWPAAVVSVSIPISTVAA